MRRGRLSSKITSMPCAAILRIKTQHGVASIQGRLGNPSRNCSIRPSKNTVALTASTGVAQAFNLHLSCVSHQQNQRLVGVRVSNMIAVSPLSALRQYVGRVYTVTGEAQSSSCVRLIASNLSRHGSGGFKGPSTYPYLNFDTKRDVPLMSLGF